MASPGSSSPAQKGKDEPAPTNSEQPITSLPSAYVADNQKVDDSSKLKTLLSILRKYDAHLIGWRKCSYRTSWQDDTNGMGLYRFIGVTDIASVRFSLPAQLMEPTPNLGG